MMKVYTTVVAFAMAIFTSLSGHAQGGLSCSPNCNDLNASILTGPGGLEYYSIINWTDIVSNFDCAQPVSYTLYSTSGTVIANGSSTDIGTEDYFQISNVCRFLNEGVKVYISNAQGTCWSKITFKKNIPVIIGRRASVYCDHPLVDDPSVYIDGVPPTAYVPCQGLRTPSFVADWLFPLECEPGVQDTVKRILREWEFFDKEGKRGSAFDTIDVFLFPQITADHIYCVEKDTVYCGEPKTGVGPFITYDSLNTGVCDTTYLVVIRDEDKDGMLEFLPQQFDDKCGLAVHVDYVKFGNDCENIYKVTVELKQSCYGVPQSTCVVDPPAGIAPNLAEEIAPGYWRCTFWVTDLDTVPPVAVCKGNPFFDGPIALDKWTFNTIRDFDFLHEEDFLGGLVSGLPPFEDIVIPDELTMLDTSKAPYSMCFASEKIVDNPDIYLGINTAFLEAEHDFEFAFNWDFLLGAFDSTNAIVEVPGAIGLIGYGINGTFYKLVEGVEEPFLDQFTDYQEFLDGIMSELQVDHELCNLNISLFLEDSWGNTRIRLEKGDVLTLFGIWISNSDAKIQFSGENIVTTNTHECAAHAYVPPLKVYDDWSGVKQVKAIVENVGTVIMQYDPAQGCYVSHQQLKLSHGDKPYKITYEVYDQCHNVGYEYCYIQVKDKTRPVAITDKGVTVSLGDKKVWVDASTFDEGSWDNCGVYLTLARRADWTEACVDLCTNIEDGADCQSYDPAHYESAIEPIWTDGHDTLWCLVLEDNKDCDPVEAHYQKQLQWLWEDGQQCSERLFNSWMYDLMRYATLNCSNAHYLDDYRFRQLVEKALKNPDADPNDHLDGLIREKFKCEVSKANAECILPFTFGRFPLLEFLLTGPSIPIPMLVSSGAIEMMYLPYEDPFCGYNDAEIRYRLDEWSQLGGGWSDAVPFSCDDACSSVTVEILVMDYWCNYAKAWVDVWVEDKVPAQVGKEVSDYETITCKSYKDERYDYPDQDKPVSIEYIVEQAKSGAPDAISALDEIFGGYEKAWRDPYGNYVDIHGHAIDTEIPFYDSICECTSEVVKYRVYDEHLGYLWKDSLVTNCFYTPDTSIFWNGIVLVNCGQNVHCEQTVWCDIDHCGEGYIYRKFKIWQSCPDSFYQDKNIPDSLKHPVDTIYRQQRIFVGNECELNKYMFDVPGDMTVYSCGVEYDPAGSGNVVGDAGPENTGYASYKFDDDCRLIGIAHNDKVFKVVGGEEACYKVIRTWYFADWCGSGGRPVKDNWWRDNDLVLDSCIQKILVVDTTAPVCYVTGPIENGGSLESGACDFDLTFTVIAVDACGLKNTSWELSEISSDPVLVDFGEYALNGSDSSSFLIEPENLLPGLYQLRVQIEDECNNQSYCEYTFSLISVKKPTPVCITSLTVDLIPWDTDQDGVADSAHAVVWANEFDQSSQAPCGQSNDSLLFFIEFKGDDTDLFDPERVADSLVVTCTDLGNRIVRMWVVDNLGAADYCDVVLMIQNNSGACDGSMEDGGSIMGQIEDELGKTIEQVQIIAESDQTVSSVSSGIDGSYRLDAPMGSVVTVTPVKNVNPTNGITTGDLVELLNHVTGAVILPSPYRRLAADVNQDGQINTFDMLELRQLILGEIEEFTNADSWRFVVKNYHFTSQVPESEPVQDQLTVNLDQPVMQGDFIGMKVGDVDMDNNPALRAPRAGNQLIFTTSDLELSAGKTYRIPLSATQFREVAGYQYTLELDNQSAAIVGVEVGNLEFLDETNFGKRHLDQGMLTTSWNTTSAGLTAAWGQTIYTITIEVRKDCRLSDVMTIGSRLTPGESYSQGQVNGVALEFDALNQGEEILLYQNAPNPATEYTTIEFYLPHDEDIQLVISDVAGKVIQKREGRYPVGKHALTFNTDDLPSGEVYFYTLMAGDKVLTKKMVLVR
jgi:hypothetical protein